MRAGTPEPLPACDCLNWCGDDDRVAFGRVQTCAHRERQAFMGRCSAARMRLQADYRQHTAGAAAALCMVPVIQARLDAATDRPDFWASLIGALAVLAKDDLGAEALVGLLVCEANRHSDNALAAAAGPNLRRKTP